MKRIILTLALLTIATSAHADWYHQDAAGRTGLTIYAVFITDSNNVVTLTEPGGNNPGLYVLEDSDVAALNAAAGPADQLHYIVVREDSDTDGYDATDPPVAVIPNYVWNVDTSYLAVSRVSGDVTGSVEDFGTTARAWLQARFDEIMNAIF